MEKQLKQYDLAVVGAGSSGLIAALFAVRAGLSVLLIEKESQAGSKLQLTGNGRCNITNINFNKDFISRSPRKNDRFLHSALNAFSVANCMAFFESLGIALKEEDRGRVFPVAGGAKGVLAALLSEISGHADIRFGVALQKIETEGKQVKGLVLADGSVASADNYLIASGSRAFPQIGADDSGLQMLRGIGHKAIDFYPGLSPIQCLPESISGLEGLSLQAVEASLYFDNKKVAVAKGDLIFTAKGVSGPLIHDLSNLLEHRGEMTKYEIRLDMLPAIVRGELDATLTARLNESGKPLVINAWGGLIPQRLAQALLARTGVDAQRLANSISRDERKSLLDSLKSFRIPVVGLPGFEQATICRGGLDLSEVDPASMRSRLYDNLYFSGEVLDLHGPSGGYNLQIAWSTGVLAAKSIVNYELRIKN